MLDGYYGKYHYMAPTLNFPSLIISKNTIGKGEFAAKGVEPHCTTTQTEIITMFLWSKIFEAQQIICFLFNTFQSKGH